MASRSKTSASSGKRAIPTTYPVTVDYSLPLWEMVTVGRRYPRAVDCSRPLKKKVVTVGRLYSMAYEIFTPPGWPSQNVGKVDVELHLVRLGHHTHTWDTLKELYRQDFRPATLRELFAFGAKYPDLQKKFPVVAIDSALRQGVGDDKCDGKYVVHFSFWLGDPDGDIDWGGLGFSSDCRFLAVRK